VASVTLDRGIIQLISRTAEVSSFAGLWAPVGANLRGKPSIFALDERSVSRQGPPGMRSGAGSGGARFRDRLRIGS